MKVKVKYVDNDSKRLMKLSEESARVREKLYAAMMNVEHYHKKLDAIYSEILDVGIGIQVDKK